MDGKKILYSMMNDEEHKDVEDVLYDAVEQSVQKEISKYEFGEDFGFDSLFAWNKLETGRMESIIVVLDHVRRVGGTYALLLANPCLRSAQKKLI